VLRPPVRLQRPDRDQAIHVALCAAVRGAHQKPRPGIGPRLCGKRTPDALRTHVARTLVSAYLVNNWRSTVSNVPATISADGIGCGLPSAWGVILKW
jgi:hypothetical protein